MDGIEKQDEAAIKKCPESGGSSEEFIENTSKQSPLLLNLDWQDTEHSWFEGWRTRTPHATASPAPRRADAPPRHATPKLGLTTISQVRAVADWHSSASAPICRIVNGVGKAVGC